MILPVLCLSVFLVVVDNTIVNVALPDAEPHLGASITRCSGSSTPTAWPSPACCWPAAASATGSGRKGTMQVGLVFFGLFSAAAAAAHTTGTLITARALMGVAAAFIFPASLAILTSVFTDQPSGRRRSASGGPPRASPWPSGRSRGAPCSSTSGTDRSSSSTCPSSSSRSSPAGSYPAAAPRAPAPLRHPRRAHLDGGRHALVLAIIEGPQWGWASPGTLACFAAAAVLLTVFTLVELRTEGPLLDVRVFTIPRFTGGALVHLRGVLLPLRLHLPDHPVLPVREGLLDAVGRRAHAAFAIVAAIFTPIAAVVALKVGTRLVVTGACC